MKKILPILIATTALIIGCKPKPLPEGILDTETMTEFLTEAYKIEGFYMMKTNNKPEEMTAEISVSYDSLLKQYNLTPEQFEKNLTYYAAHAALYDTINQRILKNLTRTPNTDTIADSLNTTTDSIQ